MRPWSSKRRGFRTSPGVLRFTLGGQVVSDRENRDRLRLISFGVAVPAAGSGFQS